MSLPTRDEAQTLLEQHVTDEYQRYHALMVATAMEGYAHKFGADADLWFITGLLHDIDFEKHSDTHPKESLCWFVEWEYPEELIHAVEAHANGYNGFTTEAATPLAACLVACDEISGIFYAYQKMNPIPFGDMQVKSIKKRLKDKGFAAKIDRDVIADGVSRLGVEMDEHIENLIDFFSALM